MLQGALARQLFSGSGNIKKRCLMEEFYSLRELVKFFQRQEKDGYIVIEAIANLINYKSENLPEDKKPQIVVDTLRKWGLYEVGFEGEKKFKENEPKLKLPEEPEKPESKPDWFGPTFTAQLEQYNVRILNCIAKFESFMN